MSERARTTRYASDDHTKDLLADILSDTEDEARAEQMRLDAGIRAKKQAEELARERTRSNELASRQAKLATELRRQEELAQRRTMRMQALRGPDEEAKPAPEVTPALDEAAIRRQVAEEVRQELRAIGLTPMPAPAAVVPAPRSRAGLFVAAAAVLIASGIAIAAFAVSNRYTPDPNPYAKSVFAPLDRAAVALEVAAIPIPKEEVSMPAPPQPVRVKTVRARPKPVSTKEASKSAFGVSTTKSDARKSFESLKAMLDEDVLGLDKD